MQPDILEVVLPADCLRNRSCPWCTAQTPQSPAEGAEADAIRGCCTRHFDTHIMLVHPPGANPRSNRTHALLSNGASTEARPRGMSTVALQSAVPPGRHRGGARVTEIIRAGTVTLHACCSQRLSCFRAIGAARMQIICVKALVIRTLQSTTLHNCTTSMILLHT